MRKSAVFFIVIFFAALIGERASFASSLGARADYSYSRTDSSSAGLTTTSKSSTQQYSLNFTKDFTNTVSLSGDMRWTITEVNGEKQENAYPFFVLHFSPPALYNLTFSHLRTETDPSESGRITTTTTSAAFHLPETRWPNVSISYNISTMEDHESPKTLDSVTSNVGLGLSKSFYFLDTDARAGYSFVQNMNEDKIAETKLESPSHSVNGDLSRSFLDNKLRASANLGYRIAESTTESTGAASRFDVGISGNAGLAFFNPALPTSVALTNEPELIDNPPPGIDTTPVTFVSACGGGATTIDLNCADWNIGLGFPSSRSIHLIYVYITTTAFEETNIASIYSFGWQVYTSPNNITWTLVASPAQTYNATLNRFELNFTETNALYFKVVNTAGNGTTDINVTEIQAVGFLLSSPRQSVTQDSTSQSGGLSLSYRPTNRLSLGFSLNYDKSEQGTVGAGGTDSESVSNSYGANANYIAIPRYLNIFANFSATSSEYSSVTDTENTTSSYALSLSSSPLDTVNLGLTFNHSESDADGERVSEAESANFSSSVMVYRGVDLGFSTVMSSSESFQSDTQSDSTSYNTNLRLVPWKSLTIMLNNSRTSATTDAPSGKTSSETTATSVDFSFTPTRRLYLSGRFNIEPTESQSYALTFSPTSKIYVSLNYHNDNSSGMVSMGGNLNWQVLGRLSVGAVYNTTSVDNATNDKTETVFARASVSF